MVLQVCLCTVIKIYLRVLKKHLAVLRSRQKVKKFLHFVYASENGSTNVKEKLLNGAYKKSLRNQCRDFFLLESLKLLDDL